MRWLTSVALVAVCAVACAQIVLTPINGQIKSIDAENKSVVIAVGGNSPRDVIFKFLPATKVAIPGKGGAGTFEDIKIGDKVYATVNSKTKEANALRVLPTPKAKPELPAFAKGLKELKFYDLELGQVGQFPTQTETFFFKVQRIIAKEEALVYSPGRATIPPFLLRGQPVEKLADESKIKLDGFYEVKAPEKVGGRTLFVVVPVSAAELEKRFNEKK